MVLLRAYEVNGLVYGCIPSWGTHQYFNGKEADSKLPDIQEGRLLKGTITQSMLTVHARLSHETLLPINPELDMHITGEDHVPPEFTENSELPTQESLPDESVSPDLSDSPSVRSSKTTRESREPARVNHTCLTREALNGKERKGKERVKTGVIKNPIHCPIAKDDVLKIFTHWQQTMQHPQARLDSSRDKWIRSALRMGYSVEDCCQAITGCSVTPHNQGCNERGERYDGLHVIFRSADQIDRFMQNATLTTPTLRQSGTTIAPQHPGGASLVEYSTPEGGIAHGRHRQKTVCRIDGGISADLHHGHFSARPGKLLAIAERLSPEPN